MAGIVEDVGPGVATFLSGDEVYSMVGGVGGLQGTFAEFIAADAALVARKPGSVSMRDAAALPLSTITGQMCVGDRRCSFTPEPAGSAISPYRLLARSERSTGRRTPGGSSAPTSIVRLALATGTALPKISGWGVHFTRERRTIINRRSP
jgi:hypothetical protein